MWMNGDSRSNLSAWLVWVSNFNSSLSSSKWFFFHCHIGMCFTFQNLLMLAWVREEKKEDFFMNICHVFFCSCAHWHFWDCMHTVSAVPGFRGFQIMLEKIPSQLEFGIQRPQPRSRIFHLSFSMGITYSYFLKWTILLFFFLASTLQT